MGKATNIEINKEFIYQKLNLFCAIFQYLKIDLTIDFISFIFISFKERPLIFLSIFKTSFKHGAQPIEDFFKSYSWED